MATVPSVTLGCKLYVDYIYLDTDERRRFAQVSHEYLIEQVQFTGSETVTAATPNKNVTLNFNHPVKELIWVNQSTTFSEANVVAGNRLFNYADSNGSRDTFLKGLLQLNGHDRFSIRNADYFRKVQNYEHHTRVPRVGADLNVTDLNLNVNNISIHIHLLFLPKNINLVEPVIFPVLIMLFSNLLMYQPQQQLVMPTILTCMPLTTTFSVL